MWAAKHQTLGEKNVTLNDTHMQDHLVINPSYYCERMKPGGTIFVLTTGAYVVAEYDERTGSAIWQRVVQANQRASIEKWLNDRFPPPAKINGRKAKAAAAAK